MITKVVVAKETEAVYEKNVVFPTLPPRKERFTIAQKEAQKARLQARIDAIDADIAEAKAIKEEIA